MFRGIAFLLILWFACTSGASNLESPSSVRREYTLKTKLPQLSEELSYRVPIQNTSGEKEFVKLRQSLQTKSSFSRTPDQNTWIVLGVIAVVVAAVVFISVSND